MQGVFANFSTVAYSKVGYPFSVSFHFLQPVVSNSSLSWFASMYAFISSIRVCVSVSSPVASIAGTPPHAFVTIALFK